MGKACSQLRFLREKGEDSMERSDWLLLLLGSPTKEGATPPLEPVRVMKGMFLLVMDGNLDDPPSYNFEPYHYGPVSLQIYDDLAQLAEEGTIEALPVLGYSWRRYRLSPEGMARYEELRTRLELDVGEEIERVKELVAGLSFRALLRHVYTRYPEYAVYSVIGRL